MQQEFSDILNWRSLRWQDGCSYEGLEAGCACESHGVVMWPSRRERYEGQLRGSKPHGHGAYRWQDGTLYRGEWYDGHMHGCGVMIWREEHGGIQAKAGKFFADDFVGPVLGCSVEEAQEAAVEADVAAGRARTFETNLARGGAPPASGAGLPASAPGVRARPQHLDSTTQGRWPVPASGNQITLAKQGAPRAPPASAGWAARPRQLATAQVGTVTTRGPDASSSSPAAGGGSAGAGQRQDRLKQQRQPQQQTLQRLQAGGAATSGPEEQPSGADGSKAPAPGRRWGLRWGSLAQLQLLHGPARDAGTLPGGARPGGQGGPGGAGAGPEDGGKRLTPEQERQLEGLLMSELLMRS